MCMYPLLSPLPPLPLSSLLGGLLYQSRAMAPRHNLDDDDDDDGEESLLHRKPAPQPEAKPSASEEIPSSVSNGITTSVPDVHGLDVHGLDMGEHSVKHNGDVPIMPGFASASTDVPTMPGFAPSATTDVPTIPGFADVPIMPGFEPSASTDIPTMPGFAPSASTDVPTMPGFAPSASTDVPTMPGFAPSASTDVPTMPGFAPSASTSAPHATEGPPPGEDLPRVEVSSGDVDLDADLDDFMSSMGGVADGVSPLGNEVRGSASIRIMHSPYQIRHTHTCHAHALMSHWLSMVGFGHGYCGIRWAA